MAKQDLTLGFGHRVFGYDEGGQLLFEGENEGGSLGIRQLIVWLDGQPVALRLGNLRRGDPYAGEWLHIHADHLGSPRAITRPAANNAVVWRWTLEGSAFGQHPAEADVDGDGVSLEFNLRYPGQYFDSVTGWHYNYFRDYEPATGRYVQSDPIGLEGGISSFSYVDASPLLWIDPHGLAKMCCRLLGNFVAGTLARQRHCYIVADDQTVYGLYPEASKGVPRLNDPRDTGGDCFDCPRPECKNQNDCFRQAHNSYPVVDYSLFGPNSNTYAGTLAKKCCKGGIPSGVSNSPAVNYGGSSSSRMRSPPRRGR